MLSAPKAPTSFIMPDIFSHCKYPLLCNPHCKEQEKASLEWLAKMGNFSQEKLKILGTYNFGVASSLSYPDADAVKLRICIDWMYFAILSDDWLDKLDVEGNGKFEEDCMAAMRDPIRFETNAPGALITKSWCARIEENSTTAFKERMIDAMQGFFRGTREQAMHRVLGDNPTMEEFIGARRYTAAGFPMFALVEFCGGYVIPENAFNHPIINSLQLAAVDHLSWVNDLASYNVEQARGDNHNLITIAMRINGWNLQQAVDFVGAKCNTCIDRFENDRKLVPSFDPETDRMVADYVMGLQHIMRGILHWSFDNGRYKGIEGVMNSKDRVVRLIPKAQELDG